jgi:DNA-binding transcriptional LysR family regulator
MNAKPQYQIRATDVETVLALVRGGTLAGAAERLGVDSSTVFRNLQRLERGMGEALFARSRSGLVPSERAQTLAAHGEQLEALMEAARGDAGGHATAPLAGTVRITTTDTVLHGLVAPALAVLAREHALLGFELHTGNELASLSRRDADIAVRATRQPPAHLVGKRIGPIRVALYAARKGGPREYDEEQVSAWPWVAPDEGLPDHPSVRWRRRHFPKLAPRYRTASVLSVAELVAQGLGVGLLPMFLAEPRADLRRLTDPIEECSTDLWLLTHPEARHLRRVGAVYGHLASTMTLPS